MAITNKGDLNQGLLQKVVQGRREDTFETTQAVLRETLAAVYSKDFLHNTKKCNCTRNF